jgi:hypothetical protein
LTTFLADLQAEKADNIGTIDVKRLSFASGIDTSGWVIGIINSLGLGANGDILNVT